MENEVKEAAPKYNYISPEEYLAIEREAFEKHEYYKGEVFAMSGASLRHNDITSNVFGALVVFLKGKNGKAYGSDLRIHIPENSLYTYPDVSIVCGKPETTDSFMDNITNPSVIIKILSKSTMNYDRGTKFNLYRSIPTLKEYVLIDSNSIMVEIYSRLNDNSWILKEYQHLSDSIYISPIDLTLLLKTIYDDVSFNE
jgi:Uma2 family endonuclease